LERHGRLAPQPPRDPHLGRVGLEPLFQFALLPAQPPQFLGHNPPRFFLRRFLSLPRVMVGAELPFRLRQQLLPESFVAQAPAPLQSLPLIPAFRATPLFHVRLELPPARRAVPRDAHFAQQPIHPQPRRPFARNLQILAITAPSIIPERLVGREQPGAYRVEMHVIANDAQVAVAAAIDDEALVAPAEEVAKEFVPPVEARRVCAEEPFHPYDQIGLRGFEHEMKMIGHETIGVDLPAGFLAGLAEGKEKALTVEVVLENGFTAVAAIHHMIDGSGIFDP
jgi:hypothetical protein